MEKSLNSDIIKCISMNRLKIDHPCELKPWVM